jgi:lipopolysaccharide/colanic/teichoic acid biosynthesis glycosyltransferase
VSSPIGPFDTIDRAAPGPITWISQTGLRVTVPRPAIAESEPVHTWRDRGRRILNFTVAAIALILALPLMLCIAIAVKVSSPGPVIFSQDRVGVDRRAASRDRRGRRRGSPDRRAANRGGKLFRILKFRTMYVSRDSERQVWASKDDPRITPVGKFLRAYRFDELPQLINVLLGHMNIVGPRPEQPVIFHELRKEFDAYPSRQRVLPGITGWAQVNQKYDQTLTDVEKKLELDLEYLERRSTMEDLKIMARTMPVIVFKQGSL